MTSNPIPAEVLGNHIAVLGKTGSGKTSTTKLAVEQVVADGFRVCVLDTVKSDWWGITSSADGKKPGLPFKILGGPRGHVPLPSSGGKVIGQLVGAGQLPLSIIDMADFEPGGLQRFFVDFAPALMRSAKGVLYLVVEEAHELAPKERSGIGAENMAIHWAKKLATAGRSKGIRLIVATQRVQALHNAVLGSCETVITHRLTTPADQEPVLKWMKANTSKEVVGQVAASLSSLPKGTGWLCSGEARIFEQIAFPKFKTYDNTATPISDGEEITVKTAAVDQDELKTIIGDAVKEAEANDPKRLKTELVKLQAQLVAAQKAIPQGADPAELQAADAAGYERGYGEAWSLAEAAAAARQSQAIAVLARSLGEFSSAQLPSKIEAPQIRPAEAPRPAPAPIAPAKAPAPALRAPGGADGVTISGSQQRLLDALAWWRQFGLEEPASEQVAFIAGYSASSSTFANLKGALRGMGLIDYPSGGKVRLTDAGASAAVCFDGPVNVESFHAAVRAKLSGAQLRLFNPLIVAYPGAMTSNDLAEAAEYSASSSTFANLKGAMRSLGLLDYPSPGQVRAADWLFPTGAP